MDDKPTLRRHHWEALREAGAARFPGAKGRIPNFTGAEAAARQLVASPEFQRAHTLKCNPDLPQRPVRHAALKAGKVVFMAVPKLASEAPFLRLDPAELPEGSLWRASSIKGASELGIPVGLEEVPPIDLVITGCVAVSRNGARLGKGGGYSDLEYGLLRETGRVGEDTPVATTVHPSQLADALPMDAHDVSIDLVATPEGLLRTARPWPRPPGILWNALPDAKIEAIPVLVERRP